jgi:hypothetical protein
MIINCYFLSEYNRINILSQYTEEQLNNIFFKNANIMNNSGQKIESQIKNLNNFNGIKNISKFFAKVILDYIGNIIFQSINLLFLKEKNSHQLNLVFNNQYHNIIVYKYFRELVFLVLLVIVYQKNKILNSLKLKSLNKLFLNVLTPKEKNDVEFKNKEVTPLSLRNILLDNTEDESKILFVLKDIKQLIKKNKNNFEKMPSYFLLIIGKYGKSTILNRFIIIYSPAFHYWSKVFDIYLLKGLIDS